MLISLPSDWVRTNRLNKGNTVFIETNEDNSISLFPSEASDSQIKDVTILYSESSVDSLINQIYGAYLLGYSDIRIKRQTPDPFRTSRAHKANDEKTRGFGDSGRG